MIPAFFLFSMMILLPESPRWLARQDRWEDCHAVLTLVHGHGDPHHPFVALELQDIKDMRAFEASIADVTYLDLFKPRMLNRTVIGMFDQIWSQLTGMNVMSKSPETIMNDDLKRGMKYGSLTTMIKCITSLMCLLWQVIGRMFHYVTLRFLTYSPTSQWQCEPARLIHPVYYQCYHDNSRFTVDGSLGTSPNTASWCCFHGHMDVCKRRYLRCSRHRGPWGRRWCPRGINDSLWQRGKRSYCLHIPLRGLLCPYVGTCLMDLSSRAVPSQTSRKGSSTGYLCQLGLQHCTWSFHACGF